MVSVLHAERGTMPSPTGPITLCFQRAGRRSSANCRLFLAPTVQTASRLQYIILFLIGLAWSYHRCRLGPWCLTLGAKAGWEQPGFPRFKFCRAMAAKYETVPGPTGLEALSGTAGMPHGFGSACRTWNHAQPDRAAHPQLKRAGRKSSANCRLFPCSGRGQWTTCIVFCSLCKVSLAPVGGSGLMAPRLLAF